jgi:predicted GNAT superfamily acetyltransferase
MKEMDACIDLQRQVWREADLEVLPVACFVIAAHCGGQVLGAFKGRELLGYTLSVPAVRNRQAYLYSYMTGVLDDYRDQGIGRRLKLFQREDALSRGIRLIEWTFDPLETRNAHFNLDRLGAIARRLIRNMYGITSSPLHRGLPTDRLLAEWHLDSPRVVNILEGRALKPPGSGAHLALPPNLDALKTNPRELVQIQDRFSSQLEELFKRGCVATATEPSPEGFKYFFEPYKDK